MPWNETTQTRFARPRDRFGSDLTDEEWNLVEPCLPPPSKRGRPRKTDLREVFNAIQFVLATGGQWRAIPHCFPPVTTVRQYFYLWSRNGVIDRMTDKLRAFGRALAVRSGSPSTRLRCRDRDGAPAVILGVLEKAPHVKKIWADGGYQGQKLASALKKLGIGSDLEIVKKSNDIKGFTVLHRRWVVERTFAWMSRCRRLAKDYERSLESSLAWAQLAACRFMTRRIARGATC